MLERMKRQNAQITLLFQLPLLIQLGLFKDPLLFQLPLLFKHIRFCFDFHGGFNFVCCLKLLLVSAPVPQWSCSIYRMNF